MAPSLKEEEEEEEEKEEDGDDEGERCVRESEAVSMVLVPRPFKLVDRSPHTSLGDLFPLRVAQIINTQINEWADDCHQNRLGETN